MTPTTREAVERHVTTLEYVAKAHYINGHDATADELNKGAAMLRTLLAEVDGLRQKYNILRECYDGQNDLGNRILKERDELQQRAEGLRRDAERFEWFFGPNDKLPFMSNYMLGVREGWTIDQWRAAIDKAMAPSRGEQA